MKKIKLMGDVGHPNEIYSSGLQFAFVSKDLKQCHAWVLCKDFLHDVVYGVMNNKDVNIYSFHYNPKTMPKPDMDSMRIIIRSKNDLDIISRMNNLSEFLNIVEARLGFKKSRIEKVTGVASKRKLFSKESIEKKEDNILMITSDKRWLHAPSLISLYALYIRIGLFHELGKSVDASLRGFKKGENKFLKEKTYSAYGNDVGYLKRSRKFRNAIMSKGTGVFLRKAQDNYNAEKLGIGSHYNDIHDKLGIVNGMNIKCWKEKMK